MRLASPASAAAIDAAIRMCSVDVLSAASADAKPRNSGTLRYPPRMEPRASTPSGISIDAGDSCTWCHIVMGISRFAEECEDQQPEHIERCEPGGDQSHGPEDFAVIGLFPHGGQNHVFAEKIRRGRESRQWRASPQRTSGTSRAILLRSPPFFVNPGMPPMRESTLPAPRKSRALKNAVRHSDGRLRRHMRRRRMPRNM